MVAWIRTAVLACAAAVGASVACSGAETFSPIPKIPCKTVYYANDPLPAAPDGASLCPPGICNYQTQKGCSVGETCAPHVDTNTVTNVKTVIPACRVAGERARGEPCDDTSPKAADQCGPGLICAEKTCHRPCCGRDWSACDPGESCIHQANIALDKTTTKYTGADLCFAVGTCNVLDLEACKAQGQTCRIADPVADVACMPASALVAGDTCDNDKPCGAGLHCVEDSSVPSSMADTSPMCSGTRPCSCRHLCPWGDCNNNTCSLNEGVCVHFNRDPLGVGECTPNWHGPPLNVDGGVVVDAGGLFRSFSDGGP